MELRGQRVLVVGLGASGIAACRLLASRGARVVANDRRDLQSFAGKLEPLRALGVELALGGHDVTLFTGVDRIIVSPGVPPLEALDAADRAGVPIASEIELASWFVEATLIGVTGTNGKSTATSLIGEMCRATGRPTFVGGNLGTPLVDVVGSAAAGPDGFVVAELSSFQLERVDTLRLHVAVLLNVSEDHLDRYARYADYVAAKARIFAGQRREDASVVPDGDPVCLALAEAGAARCHRFGGAGEVAVRDGALQDARSGMSVPLPELALTGTHNHANASAAALAARLAGVDAEPIAAALRRFPGLPHRMQHVRELTGVRFFDDSKATNVGAALAALTGLCEAGCRVVWIAGGTHKGSPYAPLRARLETCARAAVLIGEAAPLLEAALEGVGYPVVRAADMQDAVERAYRLARPGDAVLLSPACASFDMFEGYADRGTAFQHAVQSLREAG